MQVLKIKVKSSKLWEVVKNKWQTQLRKAKKDIAFAKLNNCPTSPRKMRLVADLVRGERVENALNILKFNQKEASNRFREIVIICNC